MSQPPENLSFSFFQGPANAVASAPAAPPPAAPASTALVAIAPGTTALALRPEAGPRSHFFPWGESRGERVRLFISAYTSADGEKFYALGTNNGAITFGDWRKTSEAKGVVAHWQSLWNHLEFLYPTKFKLTEPPGGWPKDKLYPGGDTLKHKVSRPAQTACVASPASAGSSMFARRARALALARSRARAPARPRTRAPARHSSQVACRSLVCANVRSTVCAVWSAPHRLREDGGAHGLRRQNQRSHLGRGKAGEGLGLPWRGRAPSARTPSILLRRR